jgi:Clostripain family
MEADTLPEDEPLEAEAHKDIKEMQKVLSDYSSSRSLEIVYQLHTKSGTTRQRLRPHGGPPPLDVAGTWPESSGEALQDFIGWARKEAEQRPTDGSMLVLWGHAHRFAIGARPVPRGVDALAFAELSTLLRPSRVGPLDIIAFDACDASMVEMAVQLRGVTRYLLASQITMPLPGFPYHRILERIADPKGLLMGPAELGTWAVRRFCDHYSAGNKTSEVSLTLLDLQQAAQVSKRIEQLARVISSALPHREDPELVRAQFTLARIISSVPKSFVDVADLCLNLVLNCRDRDIRAAALALGDLLLSPRPARADQSARGERRPFVVEHGGNACTTARLNGVNLYAPHVTGPGVDSLSLNRYDQLQFASNAWRNLVVTLALA